MKLSLSCNYKIGKILPSTHQAMPMKAGKTAKSLGIHERKFRATGGWCGQLTLSLTVEFNLLLKKMVHLTINGILHSRIGERSEKQVNCG